MNDGRRDHLRQNHDEPAEAGAAHGALHDDLSADLKALLQLAEMKAN